MLAVCLLLILSTLRNCLYIIAGIDAVLKVTLCVAGLEESRIAGVCKQTGRSRGDERGGDFTSARTYTYQGPRVAHTGVLRPHWRRVCTMDLYIL